MDVMPTISPRWNCFLAINACRDLYFCNGFFPSIDLMKKLLVMIWACNGFFTSLDLMEKLKFWGLG